MVLLVNKERVDILVKIIKRETVEGDLCWIGSAWSLVRLAQSTSLPPPLCVRCRLGRVFACWVN